MRPLTARTRVQIPDGASYTPDFFRFTGGRNGTIESHTFQLDRHERIEEMIKTMLAATEERPTDATRPKNMLTQSSVLGTLGNRK